MISVVIPLYNKAATIARAVESVQAQSFTDWEIVVVDDGSTDEGPAWVERCGDARVRLHRQANAGVAVARNRGAELARSEWLAFLDADDYWAVDHLDNLWRLTQVVPDAALFACAYSTVDGVGTVRKVVLPPDLPERGALQDYFALAASGPPPVCSIAVLIPKARFVEIGGFPRGVQSGEDLLTWARLASLGPVAYSTVATSFYEMPLGAAHERHNFLRRPQTPDVVGAGLQALLTVVPPHQTPGLRAYLAGWMRMRAVLFLELNERFACFGALRDAAAWSRWTVKDLVCVGLLLLPQRVRTQLIAKVRHLRGRA